MSLEFGLPRTYHDAIVRAPGITDADYNKLNVSVRGCANFRTWLTDITTPKLFVESDLITRSFEIPKESLALLRQVNSFRRNMDDRLTFQWSRLDNIKWTRIFPTGDDNYRWWEITKFEPAQIDSKYSLFCVEVNKKFKSRPTYTRFDEYSDFIILMATDEEISMLTKELSIN